MRVYLIAQVQVTDPAEYAKYIDGFMPVLEKFQGECLCADNHPRVIEGNWPKWRTVLLRFPSEDAVQKWYHSPEYQEIARHRFKSSKANIAVIDELPEG